MHMTLTAH